MTEPVLPRLLFARAGQRPVTLMMALTLALAGCATSRYSAEPTPHYKVGKPYKVNGRWYRPAHEPGYDKTGMASWYGRDFHGRATANGELYNMNALTAAHTTLPMPSMVEVTNLENRRRVVVRVNDRGPFASNRIIDLSRAAARRLGFEKKGLAKVRVRYLGPAPLPGERKGPENRIAAKSAASVRTQAIAQVRNGVTGAVETVDESTAVATPAAKPTQAIILASATTPGVTPWVSPPPPAEPRATTPVSEPPAAAPDTSADAKSPPAETVLYAIRVAALSNLDNLEAVRASLGAIGTLRLARAEIGEGRVVYRINMGPYSDPGEAAKRLEAVREAGYADAKVITIKP